MPYKLLGSRYAVGAADTTGQNPGNWTVQFPASLINVNVPEAEIYKMVVQNGAPTATFNVYVNNTLWDLAVYAPHNSWDPQQPLIIRPGDSLFFYYSDPATDGYQPNVTIWLRYEITLPFFGVTT